ncbi:hypothetical protein, partial [Bradyrhizobium ivorense]|uniref:hypothetical protein n=1 Tax=Bradyrhizobium ivorense TaxID=2511166 RepID=UPI001E5F14F7
SPESAAPSRHDNADAGAAMTATNVLDWVVALFVCWASLTAIVQSPHETAQCDAPYTTGSAVRIPPPTPAKAEIEAMIRDMKLHD